MKVMRREGDDGGVEGDVVARKAPERIWVQNCDGTWGEPIPAQSRLLCLSGQKIEILARRN
jgi:hypothetical protein